MKLEDKNIVLIGMMGSGKTTVGKMLAKEMSLNFVDTDKELEEKIGRSISEIFATDGEDEFRRLEEEIVKQVAERGGQVIATGGGVVLKPENIKVLRKKGIIIFLYTAPQVLIKRLKDDDSRPLIKCSDPERRLKELLRIRLPLYRKAAQIEVDTGRLTPDQVVRVLVEKIQEGSGCRKS
ncbi:hypothetical protein BBF96_12700 [Anoxybacter fermentans]|uniref:Shikimate kinase n=1 Tax=Anoxybacter fermentans TaxID=1323375 RepID=A0A3S9T0W0_9FIRM|nr:shikimate kinase [Anoxybacter fermentans]AZR74179.1 hypothetical protein BBF96_12700 [Anoxybacter fermentans]